MWAYPEIRTLGGYPAFWARHDANRAALKTLDRVVSFAEFDTLANRTAHFLLEQGADADQLIGFMGKNSVDFYLAFFGCARTRSGLVVLIRQPAITKGYWRQPETTAGALEHGWYRSGDIARRADHLVPRTACFLQSAQKRRFRRELPARSLGQSVEEGFAGGVLRGGGWRELKTESAMPGLFCLHFFGGGRRQRRSVLTPHTP